MKKILLTLLLCCWGMADSQILSLEEIKKIEVESSSFQKMHVATHVQEYLHSNVAIPTAYHMDLRSTSAIEKLDECNLSNYLDAYFPNEKKDFYTLSKQDSQNTKYLESLLLSDKKIIVFLNLTDNWATNGNVIYSDKNSHVLGAQGFLFLGFDHDARYFIAKSCHQEGNIRISYDYVAKYICSSFYPHGTFQEHVNTENRNVNFEITRWKVGSGNFFTPYARVNGVVKGHPAFIKWLRIVIEFRGKKRVILKQRIAGPEDSFKFKEKYTRFGSRYCILECTNNDFEVTRFVKRSVKE